MDVINELVLQVVASPWLYLALFSLTVIDGFFPPVPSETVLVAAAAVLASSGTFWSLLPLGLTAAAGAVIGDNIAFALGRSVGTDRWRWMRTPRVVAAIDSAGHALERRSAALLLGARYIPVGRVAVNVSAGALGFPWRKFLPLSMVAATSWSIVSMGIGLMAGSWFSDHPVAGAGIGVAVALSIGIAIDRVTARHRVRDLSVQLTG